MLVKVSDLIADFIVSKSCDTVFTVTGGGAMHLNDSLGHHNKLHCIYNHNEQGCSVAAEGYARTSGKPAVVCVTSGPGGTNAITGVMGSWVDSIPMFVLSGQVKFSTTISSCKHLKLRQLGDQEFNIVDAVTCMTKYSKMITNENEILYHLEKAWYTMLDGRKGPVWLDVPLNIQGAKVDTDKLIHFIPNEKKEYEVFSSQDAIELFEDIKKAKAPILFAGTAIRNENYVNEFVTLAHKLNIPVVTAWNAHDTMDSNDKLYCGRPATVGTRAGNFVVQKADLVLVIGSQLNIRQISYNWENFAKNAKVYLVDFDKNEINKPTLNIYKSYCVDLKNMIDECNKCIVDSGNHQKWIAWCKQIYNKYSFEKNMEDIKDFANPYLFIKEFSNLLNEEDTIVCSNGSACVVTFQAFNIKQGQRMFTNSGCASMGYGLPASIGSAIAQNGKRVICIEGDGSLQMNIQELATVRGNNLNIKILVINNDGYHSIRQTQTNLFKGKPYVGINAESGVWIPSLEKIANAYEIPYYIANSSNQIDIINKFLNEDGPSILEVMVDKNQKFQPKLSSKILPDGTMVSATLDDMFPFLPTEEYESINFED